MSPPADQAPPAARFIARAAVWEARPVDAPPSGGAPRHGVYGDGRLLRTPAGHALILPSRALAEAIAAELRAQIPAQTPSQTPARPAAAPDIAAMPHLRLAATALDRVAAAREATVAATAAYGETDLLCYRAERPADLVARQHAAWQPLLDWVALRFDAPLALCAGVMPQPQAPAALAALRAAVAGYDDLMLAALAFAVQTSGSLVIGLALAEGRLDAQGAFVAAELDESYQIETWGEDAEAGRRRDQRRRDLADAAAFMILCRENRLL